MLFIQLVHGLKLQYNIVLNEQINFVNTNWRTAVRNNNFFF